MAGVSKARCKFRCDSVEPLGGDCQRVKLWAQYDEPLSREDEAFNVATPSGNLDFTINNPRLVGFFQPGRQYYVDVMPADSLETGSDFNAARKTVQPIIDREAAAEVVSRDVMDGPVSTLGT